MIGIFGTIPSATILILALISLKRLFRLYEKASYFELANVAQFKFIGKLVFLNVFANMFENTMFVLAKTFDNPVGERTLRLSFGSSHVKEIIIAIIIIIISRIMEEGRKINNDNRLTV